MGTKKKVSHGGKKSRAQNEKTPTADRNEPSTFEILCTLANDMREQECYLQAVKFLEAASTIPDAIPVQRAVACLSLATIVLDRFDNVDYAKERLLQAEREVRNSKGQESVKMQVCSLLCHCHFVCGDIAKAISACESGLEICKSWENVDGSATTVPGKSVQQEHGQSKGHKVMRWRVYFLFHMLKCECRYLDESQNFSKVHCDEKGRYADDTRAHVEEILKELDSLKNRMSHEEKSILACSRAIVDMKMGNTDSADKYLTETATELGNAYKKSSDKDKMALESMRGQYYLLYAMNAQLSGRSGQLASGNSYPAFDEFFKSMDKLDKMAGGGTLLEPPGCVKLQPPMPHYCAKVLGELVHASLLRISGRATDAALKSGKMEEDLEHMLLALGLPGKSHSQQAPGTNNWHLLRPVLRLQCVALEYQALSYLVACDFLHASKVCLDLGEMIQVHQEDLRVHRWSFCMLLGQYFHSTGEYDSAISLFDCVQKNGPQHLRNMAAMNAAVTEIHSEDKGSTLSASLRMKDARLDSTGNLACLSARERSFAQLINGIILYKNQDPTGARLLLTKALKQAHGMIGSSQFVGQVLNMLAPVQKEREDRAGALQMFESATTLLKSVKDIMSLVTTLTGMATLYQEAKDTAKSTSCKDYLDRKMKDLQTRLQLLYDAEEHRRMIKLAGTIRQLTVCK